MKRAYVVNQADLRMDGNLAMNVKRVLPVTQADVATAAAQGIFWNVKRYEVVNTLDNLRGGTQRILKVNAPAPGVQRAFLTSATTIVTVLGVPPLVLPDAIDGDIVSLKAFGGTEQGLPDGYTALTYIENSATTLVPLGVSFGTSNFKMEITAVVQNGSLNLFQSQTSGGLTRGIGGSSANTIYGKAGSINDVSITANNYRTAGHKYAISFTAESGTGTLKVDDLTAETTETVTGTYTTGVDSTEEICLFGNTQAQYVGAGTQIFSAKLWKDGALVLDLVPSRQGATKGFFDLVSRTFKTASTGTLLAGADTTLVPTTENPIDIVCNNGVLKYGQYGKNLFNPNIATASGYLDSTGAHVANAGWLYTTDYVSVKPSTTYTFNPNSTVGGLPKHIYYDANKNILGNTGTGLSTFTTPATCAYMRFSYRSTSYDIQLELGSMVTPYEPYHFGLHTDGTVETINVHGKNLFDKNSTNIANGWWNANAQVVGSPLGTVAGSSNYHTSEPIPVIPNTTYTVVGCGGSDPSFLYLDKDLNFVSGFTNINLSSRTITVPNNPDIKYLRFPFTVSTVDTCQFEQGSTATEYQPYFDGGTATCEDLLSVGTYTDEQEVISGNVTRKVGVKVFNGTEAWAIDSSGGTTNGILFNVNISGAKPEPLANKVWKCSHFNCTSAGKTSIQNGEFRGSSSNINFFFRYGTSTTTLDEWKQWLSDQYTAGTPVIVVYPLATSTTETVTGQPMQTVAGDNIVEITQASMSGLELEVTYNAGVVLTVEEVEDAQLSPDVEVTIQ